MADDRNNKIVFGVYPKPSVETMAMGLRSVGEFILDMLQEARNRRSPAAPKEKPFPGAPSRKPLQERQSPTQGRQSLPSGQGGQSPASRGGPSPAPSQGGPSPTNQQRRPSPTNQQMPPFSADVLEQFYSMPVRYDHGFNIPTSTSRQEGLPPAPTNQQRRPAPTNQQGQSFSADVLEQFYSVPVRHGYVVGVQSSSPLPGGQFPTIHLAPNKKPLQKRRRELERGLGKNEEDKKPERELGRDGMMMERSGVQNYPLANVLEQFYGAPVGQGYGFEIRNEGTGRVIELFRDANDQATRFRLVPRNRDVAFHETGWDLVHTGTGRAVAHNLVYNPVERRFYIRGDVLPDAFLSKLRAVSMPDTGRNVVGASGQVDTFQGGQAHQVPGEIQIPFMVHAMQLDNEDTYLSKGLDGDYYVLKREGDNWRVLSRMSRDTFQQALQQSPSQQVQQTGDNWMRFWEFILPILLIILARRG